MELRQVKAHLSGVLQRVVLEGIFLEPVKSSRKVSQICGYVFYLRDVDLELISASFQFENGEVVFGACHFCLLVYFRVKT